MGVGARSVLIAENAVLRTSVSVGIVANEARLADLRDSVPGVEGLDGRICDDVRLSFNKGPRTSSVSWGSEKLGSSVFETDESVVLNVHVASLTSSGSTEVDQLRV